MLENIQGEMENIALENIQGELENIHGSDQENIDPTLYYSIICSPRSNVSPLLMIPETISDTFSGSFQLVSRVTLIESSVQHFNPTAGKMTIPRHPGSEGVSKGNKTKRSIDAMF